MIKSAYLDTSVFGGYYDDEFSEPTIRFFDRINKERIELIVSEVLISELENAPEHVRNLLKKIPSQQIYRIDVNPESEELARTYLSEKVVGKTLFAHRFSDAKSC